MKLIYPFIIAMILTLSSAAVWAQSDPLENSSKSNPAGSGAVLKGVPVAPINIDEDAPSLHSYMRFQSLEEIDAPSLKAAIMNPGAFKKLSSSSFNMGPAKGPLTMVVTVRNTGHESGEWLFTTNRGALRNFTFDEWDGQKLERRIDGQNMEQVKHVLQTYHSFTHAFKLDVGQIRTFVISFEPIHSTLVPLEIKSREAMASWLFTKLAITIGSSIGLLTIVLISVSIYSFNGRPQFLWMGVAEIAHTFYVLHVGGYTTFYLLYNTGPLIHTVGYVLPQLFAISMAQFARSFINTNERFKTLDRMLLGLIILGAIMITIQFIKNHHGDPSYLNVFNILSGVVSTIIIVILPYVAIIATKQLGRHHWPLIVAWSSLCLFVLYTRLVAFGLLKTLPFSWHLTGPIGLFETIFAFWALVLYLDKLNRQRLKNAVELSESLIAQQKITEEASRLILENEDALSTIRDQENLIHASGHDSQHVLMALKTIIKSADKLGPDQLQRKLPEMLRSSAGHLENIINTTLANPVAGFQSANFVTLSTFSTTELLRNMEKIYGPMMRKEQMKIRLRLKDDFMLVSDRALLARILSNLLSNCLKFAKGSNVIISVHSETDQLHIIISDNGNGIPDEIINKIRDVSAMRIMPSNSETGTGFGLISSKRIAAALGGSLEIEKTFRGGAAVAIVLPHSSKGDFLKTITTKKIENLLPSYQLVDVDNYDDIRTGFETDLPEILVSNLPLLPITFDNSPQMASRVNQFAALVLIKPVTLPMIQHPILSEISQRHHENQKAKTDDEKTISEDGT